MRCPASPRSHAQSAPSATAGGLGLESGRHDRHRDCRSVPGHDPVLAASGEVDALIVIFVRPLLTTAEDAAEAVSRAISELPRELPLLAVFMSSRDRAR